MEPDIEQNSVTRDFGRNVHVYNLIFDCIKEAKNLEKWRESSLVITKLEEALMWMHKVK